MKSGGHPLSLLQLGWELFLIPLPPSSAFWVLCLILFASCGCKKAAIAPCIMVTFKAGSKGVRNGLFCSDSLLLSAKSIFSGRPLQTFCYCSSARTKSWLFVTMTGSRERSLSLAKQDSPLGLCNSPKTSVRKDREGNDFCVAKIGVLFFRCVQKKFHDVTESEAPNIHR